MHGAAVGPAAALRDRVLRELFAVDNGEVRPEALVGALQTALHGAAVGQIIANGKGGYIRLCAVDKGKVLLKDLLEELIVSCLIV